LFQNENIKLKARAQKLIEITPPGFIDNHTINIFYLEQFVTYALKQKCDYNEQ
jgi:hypothetical protein